jgi:hypothetical protein
MDLWKTMSVMIDQPWIALIPASLLAALYFFRRRRFVLVVAAVWALYAIDEYGNKLRILCSGECNIRVDLLLIYPLLLLLTLSALIIAVKAPLPPQSEQQQQQQQMREKE